MHETQRPFAIAMAGLLIAIMLSGCVTTDQMQGAVTQGRLIYNAATGQIEEAPPAETPAEQPEEQPEEVEEPLPILPVPDTPELAYNYNRPKTTKSGKEYKTTLPMDKNWILECKFLAMKGGGFQRYLTHESRIISTLDLFHHDGRLALRIANRKVFFRGATKGTISKKWKSDHVAFTEPVSLDGNTAISIAWHAKEKVVECKVNEKLVGRWVCSLNGTPPTTKKILVEGCKQVQIRRGIAR